MESALRTSSVSTFPAVHAHSYIIHPGGTAGYALGHE